MVAQAASHAYPATGIGRPYIGDEHFLGAGGVQVRIGFGPRRVPFLKLMSRPAGSPVPNPQPPGRGDPSAHRPHAARRRCRRSARPASGPGPLPPAGLVLALPTLAMPRTSRCTTPRLPGRRAGAGPARRPARLARPRDGCPRPCAGHPSGRLRLVSIVDNAALPTPASLVGSLLAPDLKRQAFAAHASMRAARPS